MIKRKPPWIKTQIPSGNNFIKLKKVIKSNNIYTICNEALCPNLGECSKKGIATFLILGDKCTRNCLYCNVKFGKSDPVDLSEPTRIAKTVKNLGLKYVVVTSVTRDDLPDGGSGIFVDTINQIKLFRPSCKTEVLVPDFMEIKESINAIVEAKPLVFGHNLETTEDFFNILRPQGNYRRSLNVLKTAKIIYGGQITKSGIMIGFGETIKQIIKSMKDLQENGVDIFTLGQYLQPSKNHYPVIKYYTPDEFKYFEKVGYELGFSFVNAGPLVRSSYMANENQFAICS